MLNQVGSDEAAVALGSRVRSMRQEQGLTLKELGRRADLSHPFLSQLERGLARPSIASMERIARGLGVSVGVLWSDAERRSQVALVRSDAGDRTQHFDASAPGHLRTMVGLGHPLNVCEWTGGSRRWPPEARVLSGEVLIYVARGGVEVDIDGDVHALEEGDTLIFDGGIPHRVRRTGPVATRALRVIAPLPPSN